MPDRTLSYDLGEHLQHRINPLLVPLLPLLPDYLTFLEVRYNPASEDLVRIGVDPEYRQATMDFGPGFFTESEDRQRSTLAHEFMHVQVAELAACYDALLEATVPEDAPLRRWAKNQWARAEEGVVTDLAAATERIRGTSPGRAPVTGFARA